MPSLDINQEIDTFSKFYTSEYKKLNAAAEYVRSVINSILVTAIPVQGVLCRIKTYDECISKFRRKYQKELEEKSIPYEIKQHISDLIGIRVICLYEPDIQKIIDMMYDNFSVIRETHKSNELNDTVDRFGYKSVHFDFQLDSRRRSLPENKDFQDYQYEIQIRTIIQDAWSVLDHKIKYKKNVPTPIKRRINRLAALFELADEEFSNIQQETINFERQTVSGSKPADVLSVFSFLRVIELFFPGYNFVEYKVDGFLHEILQHYPLTETEFKELMEKTLPDIKKYNAHLSETLHFMNPYTMLRHCLYLHDRDNFHLILYPLQRSNFIKWLDRTDNLQANFPV